MQKKRFGALLQCCSSGHKKRGGIAAGLQLRPQEEGGYCCSAAAQATRRGRRIQRGGCTRHQQTRRVTTFTEAKWWLADAHRAHVRGGVRESAPAGNRAKCEREHAVEVGHRREQLLHESGLSLAGVVGSARRCGGAVGRVRAVTVRGKGFRVDRINGVTAQACRAAICSGARHSGSGASRVQRA